jgi:hypothetical protein
MLAHGFTTELLVRLVRDGLASAKAKHMVADGQRLDIARVKFTAAGREGTRGNFRAEFPQLSFWRLSSLLLYLSGLGAKPQRRA